MAYDPQRITFFAKTDARGANVPFGIKAIDRTRHMYVIGKTGMGKSTLLENMAVQDIKNGEGMAFIDPHGATAETLLDYIPAERKDDVLYFAPFDTQHPIAFNVMEDVGPERRHLVVSGLMSVFKKIWVDAWSARMEYILQNTLLALLEYPDSTLLGVNRMLSDKKYRKRVVDNIKDPAVRSFWVDEFANYNERYMQEAGDAIKNKIGQFTANPLIRNIIGQPKSSFDLRKMMDEQKIIIMNLSKGLVGESNANLLGSMLTTRIYLAAMSRADMSQEKMRQAPNFYFYVDEFQSFANATFADILSEARKYKLNLTIAHQYIEQMEEDVRNAVFGNVGTIAAFRVGPFDAEVLETIFSPQFLAVDICNLGFAQIYLTLMIDGIGSQPFSAKTLPPIEQTSSSCKGMVIASSRTQFARDRATVEQMINDWHRDVHESEMEARRATSTPEGEKGSERTSMQKKRSEIKPDSSSEKSSGRERPAFSASGTEPRNISKRPARSEVRVDDLRAVLATIAANDTSTPATKKNTEVNPKPTTTAPLPEQKSTPVVKQTKSDEKRTTAKASGASAPTGDLKQALAAVLAEHQKKTTSESKPKEGTPPIAPSPKQAAPLAPPSSKHDRTKPDDSPATPSSRSAGQAAAAQIEDVPTATEAREAANNGSARVSPMNEPSTTKSSTGSAFDAKELERMMRVKTSDKTPFK